MDINVLTVDRLAISQSRIHTGTTDSPVLWVRWDGAVDSGATIAVDASTGDLSFTTDGSTADTTISTDGTIDVSSSGEDTLGEVLDTINASPNWTAVLLAGLRSQSSNNTLTTLTGTNVSTQVYKQNGIFLYGDGAVSPNYMTSVITGFDPQNYVKGRNPDIACISFLKYVYALGTFSSAGTLYIYSATQRDETLLYSYSLTSGTASEFGSISACGSFISSIPQERLVIIIDDDGTTANDMLKVSGYTTDLTAKRLAYLVPTN